MPFHKMYEINENRSRDIRHHGANYDLKLIKDIKQLDIDISSCFELWQVKKIIYKKG